MLLVVATIHRGKQQLLLPAAETATKMTLLQQYRRPFMWMTCSNEMKIENTLNI